MGCEQSARTGRLLLRLQPGVVLADERLDLRCARQDAEPLFFIERDWKAAHAIQRHCAFLAHLQSDATLVFALELGILCPQTLQLRLHLRFIHRFPPAIRSQSLPNFTGPGPCYTANTFNTSSP